MEVPSGFEPLNIGFADRPLRPLGHGTFLAWVVWYPEVWDDGGEGLMEAMSCADDEDDFVIG